MAEEELEEALPKGARLGPLPGHQLVAALGLQLLLPPTHPGSLGLTNRLVTGLNRFFSIAEWSLFGKRNLLKVRKMTFVSTYDVSSPVKMRTWRT